MTHSKMSPLLIGLVVACLSGVAQVNAEDDWANLTRYHAADAELKPPARGVPRIVFLGDSITDFWIQRSPDFFKGKPFVDRGISGQISPQMLVRFQQDVVALRPKAVLILAGINDILQSPDPAKDERIEDNIKSMVTIAKSAGITPIVCALLPTGKGPKIEARVQRFNGWLSGYAKATHIGFVDYFSAMADHDGNLPAGLTADGLHPNLQGYEIMQPLALKAITQAGIHLR